MAYEPTVLSETSRSQTVPMSTRYNLIHSSLSTQNLCNINRKDKLSILNLTKNTKLLPTSQISKSNRTVILLESFASVLALFRPVQRSCCRILSFLPQRRYVRSSSDKSAPRPTVASWLSVPPMVAARSSFGGPVSTGISRLLQT